MQMQTQMSGEGSSKGILNEPQHILSFVLRALEAGTITSTPSNLDKEGETRQRKGLTKNDLRIVDEHDDEDGTGDGDSDDETPRLDNAKHDDEMTATAINLLLSV